MYRDPDLLRLAQGEKCLLECHPYCDGDEGSTTVACHSNEIIHNKGKGIKADDCMSVWVATNATVGLIKVRCQKEKKQRSLTMLGTSK